MSRNTFIRWSVAAIGGLLLLLVGGFTAARLLGSGKVLGSVEALGIELGGLTEAAAAEALAGAEAELAATPVRFVIGGQEAVLVPETTGFAIDTETLVDVAMANGREGGLSAQFRWWLGHFGDSVTLETQANLAASEVEKVLQVWDVEFVGDPPVEGAIAVEGSTPVAIHPKPGRQLDRDSVPELMLASILSPPATPTSLPVTASSPQISTEAVEAALATAELWLSAPVTLVAEDGENEAAFSVADLAAALRSEARGTELRLFFDPEPVTAVLEQNRDVLEQPPRDAEFQIEGYEVTVVPGRKGTLLDPETNAEELARAASTSSRRGTLNFLEGADPEVTTEHLEELGITHLVSQFTTYHDCCQNRVTNIHLFADAVDGAVVASGETFSLNEHVGPRTAEAGYLEDGTIIRGELVKTVGGGVSQFATTFYNAVFWGGYEDVTHKPHSFYFSRYPEGIEATISWPLPELEFRNDSDNGILIRTTYTDTSITVTFYGDNDGRILIGAHRRGNTEIEVVQEGGDAAKRVRSSVSGRSDFTEPTIEYRENPEIVPGEPNRLQSPAQGWTVSVERTITVGNDTTEEQWVVRYLPRREILEVHPCEMPESTEECPEPTTTTLMTDDSTTTTTIAGDQSG